RRYGSQSGFEGSRRSEGERRARRSHPRAREGLHRMSLMAVLAVVLSLPGMPERASTKVVHDIETCFEMSRAIRKEVYAFAVSQNIPFKDVKLEITCKTSIPVDR